MKIYDPKPIKFIRLEISKIGEETFYIPLIETDKEEVKKMLEEIILQQQISPFVGGKKTKICVREALGGVNGKSESVSFYGIGTEKINNLIVSYLTT